MQFERDRLALFAARGFDGQSRRVRGPSGRETYAIAREDESAPTLLIHGGAGIGTEWADMANRLDGTVVIVDRPGFGLSDGRDDRGVDFKADAARWLVELVDGLGAEQVNVVGA